MPWIVRRTDTFLASFRRVRDNSKVILDLTKKIKRLQADPLHVGGGCQDRVMGKNLHGLQNNIV